MRGNTWWTLPAKTIGEKISYPPIADGKVFVTVRNASSGTTLFALESQFGGLLWSFELGGFSQWSGSCYENGRVLGVNGSGLLRAFDGATGDVIWNVQLPNQHVFSAPPTVSDGVIYVSEESLAIGWIRRGCRIRHRAVCGLVHFATAYSMR